MSQLARRENAPHRAAFVTSLSRGISAVCLATCLLSIPACLRRGGPVLPLAGLRYPTDILPGNQGTASHFRPATSLPGTGRGCRQPGTRLPGDIPARPRFTDEYTLRHRDAFQRGTWPASGRWNQDDLGNLCRR